MKRLVTCLSSLRAFCGLLLVVALPMTVDAQYSYTAITNRIITLTITGYGGPGGTVVIPGAIDGHLVTSIGDRAFVNAGITNVTIPLSITNIGTGAFQSCTRLGAILVSAVHPAYTSMDGILFNKSLTTLIACPGGKVGSYTIPNSVTSIVENAFGGCASLTASRFPTASPTLEITRSQTAPA